MRRALGTFWKQARETLRLELQSTNLCEEEITGILSLLNAGSTAEHREMLEAERLEVLKNTEQAASIKQPEPVENSWGNGESCV